MSTCAGGVASRLGGVVNSGMECSGLVTGGRSINPGGGGPIIPGGAMNGGGGRLNVGGKI